MAEHSWKFRAVNIPADMNNLNVQAQKQEETDFCFLKTENSQLLQRKISVCLSANTEYYHKF